MRILLLTGLLLCIAACGQKGDLYLPEEGGAIPGAGTCRSCPPVQSAPESAEPEQTEATQTDSEQAAPVQVIPATPAAEPAPQSAPAPAEAPATDPAAQPANEKPQTEQPAPKSRNSEPADTGSSTTQPQETTP